MHLRRRRPTIAGLMSLVALAAVLVAWLRPMTPREAARVAVDSVHRRGARAIFDDPALPARWRAHEVREIGSGDYTVTLVPADAEGSGHRLKVWVDAGTGDVSQAIRGWANPAARRGPASRRDPIGGAPKGAPIAGPGYH